MGAAHFVGACFRHQGVGAQQGLELARVRPPTVEHFVSEFAFVDIEIVDVRDFQFSAAGGF